MGKRRQPSTPRDERGRFRKGFSGHPSGRPKATRNKSTDQSHKIAIKRGAKTLRVDPEPIILKRLATAALGNEFDEGAAKLYLRERRLTRNQELRARQAQQPRRRSQAQPLYWEVAFLALGALKRNGCGQLVIPRGVFADLDRANSRGEFSAKDWKAIQLAVETPEVLRNRYPRRRLAFSTERQANRARAEAIEAGFTVEDPDGKNRGA